ncbi:MAG: hypothetical protein MJK13_10100, partial [Pseudomonadales bacterium]|nr:hypothetical protein [Pseudomonadales bacterium]
MTKTTTVFSSTKQKVSIICTLILLLLGLFYAFSPMLIGLLLERQLKQYGIASSSRIEHPGIDQLKLAAAHFTIDRPEFQGQITVTELSLKYNWLDLLLRQKIKQIHIRKLDIQLSDNHGQAAPSVSTELALAALLPATLLSEVAINQLQIETLQLSWDKNPQQQISVFGELLLNPEQLRLRGDYFENGTLLGSLQTEFNAENQFLIKGELLAQQPPQNQTGNQSYFNFQLEGDIQAAAGKFNIRARQKINFKQFKLQSFWLSPLLTPSQLQQLSSLEAQLQLNHQLSMPLAVTDTDNWLAQLQADTSFDLQIAQRQFKLPLADKSLSAAKIKLSSSGTFSWSQRQLAIEMHPSTNIEINDFNSPQSYSERINISLRSALKLSFDRQFRINKIPSFTASIDASPWRTSIGEFSHLPLTINVRQADLLKRLLAVDFQLHKLNLDNSQAQIRLPFQQLSSSIQGHFSLQQNNLKLSLQEGLALAISQLSSAGSSTVKTTIPDSNRAQAAEYFTEQLKVTTDSAINLSLDT